MASKLSELRKSFESIRNESTESFVLDVCAVRMKELPEEVRALVKIMILARQASDKAIQGGKAQKDKDDIFDDKEIIAFCMRVLEENDEEMPDEMGAHLLVILKIHEALKEV